MPNLTYLTLGWISKPWGVWVLCIEKQRHHPYMYVCPNVNVMEVWMTETAVIVIWLTNELNLLFMYLCLFFLIYKFFNLFSFIERPPLFAFTWRFYYIWSGKEYIHVPGYIGTVMKHWIKENSPLLIQLKFKCVKDWHCFDQRSPESIRSNSFGSKFC